MIRLTPDILLEAYAAGIFPMAESAGDKELFWVDPTRRGILPLDGFHVPRRLHISGIELGVVHRPRLLPDVLTERATRCRPPDAGLPRQALELEDRMPEDSTEPDVLADVHDPAYLIG